MKAEHASPAASLRELAARLLADAGRLVDQRIDLLKAELRQEGKVAARAVAALGAGAMAAGVGMPLLLLALGLWVGELIGSTPGGLALVGAGLILVGAALGLLAVKSLRRLRIAPETVRELRRDAEWIHNGR